MPERLRRRNCLIDSSQIPLPTGLLTWSQIRLRNGSLASPSIFRTVLRRLAVPFKTIPFAFCPPSPIDKADMSAHWNKDSMAKTKAAPMPSCVAA